jgi:dihydropyrimidinase
VSELAEAARVRVHFAHLSTAAAVDTVRRAKGRGLPVTAETCPHYLLLSEQAYTEADARQYSVIPPLRRIEDSSALWAALSEGSIDTVATDHCPFARADKASGDDVLDVPCGLPGVETLLPLLYSEGVVTRGLSLAWLVRTLCERPARIFGLAPRKGAIEPGADADLALLDPEKNWTIRAQDLHGNIDFSPYEGYRGRGAVRQTLVRGRVVWADGEFPTEPGWGRFVPRAAA